MVIERLSFPPTQRSRLSRQIAAELCQLIQQGELQPGHRLPAERDLAERLQVSRASLREALRILEASGVIESRHGGGTFVRALAVPGVYSPLALVVGAPEEIVGDLCEARTVFEPPMAMRAALRATAEEIAALRQLLEQQASVLRSDGADEAFLSLDRDFHAALAGATHNTVAVRTVEFLNQMLYEARRHFMATPERRRNAYDRHREILEAVESHDPTAAERTMQRHLREVEDYIVRGLFIDSDSEE